MSQERQKILYVITKGNWGGAQKYVYDLATALPRDTYEVVVAFGGSGVLKQKLEEKNIRVIPLESLGRDIRVWKDVTVFFSLLSLFLREKPDVVHLNSSKIGGLGALAARIYNVYIRLKNLYPKASTLFPVLIIFTAHGWAFNEDRGMLARFAIRMVHYTTIMLSHVTIAVSQSMIAQIKPLFLKKKMVLIYNGVRDISFLTRREARQRIETCMGRNLPAHAHVIGTIAELHKNKGLTYSIHAMKHVPNSTYIIVGEGKERETLQSLIHSSGLSERIFLAGHIDEASHILPAFDAFLLPSITEAFAYVIMEAGNAKLPTVATKVGGIPEIVSEGESGILIPTKNPEAIAKAILSLKNDPAQGARYGNMLYQTVKQKFSFENMIFETRRVYESH